MKASKRVYRVDQPDVQKSCASVKNFTKFLVSREGQVLKRYAPSDTPEKIEDDLRGMIEQL